jgi:hypothetical protein
LAPQPSTPPKHIAFMATNSPKKTLFSAFGMDEFAEFAEFARWREIYLSACVEH